MAKNNASGMTQRLTLEVPRLRSNIKVIQCLPAFPSRDNPYDLVTTPKQSLDSVTAITSFPIVIATHRVEQRLQNFTTVVLDFPVKFLPFLSRAAGALFDLPKAISIEIDDRNLMV